MTMICLGRYVYFPLRDQPPRILCQDAALLPHIHQPWFRAYANHYMGLSALERGRRDHPQAIVPEAALARHCLCVGATGSGKSRMARHLLTEQLKRGCSAVVFDPKPDQVAHILACASDLGLAAEQVTLLSPRLGSPPGWNPLAFGLPIAQAAGDFVALLQRSTTS